MADREPTLSHHSDRWRDAGTGEVGAPAGPSGIHLVATLYFDSLDAKPAWHRLRGRPRPAIAELYFFDTNDA
jgi:hypothetical protein